MQFPTWGAALVHGVTFDVRAGIGHGFSPTRGPDEADVFVAMRPSVFLALATPLPVPRASLGWLVARLAEGRALCPAALRVWCPARGVPAVLAHDGRHRMTALLARLGDLAVPVRLAVADHDDAALAAVLDALRGGMRAQRGGAWRPGPLFAETSLDEDRVVAFGTPPPARRSCQQILAPAGRLLLQ